LAAQKDFVMRAMSAGLLLAVAFPLVAASYERETVVSTEVALTRLGYDIGPSDGKWSAVERKSMNELRAKNGLPPADALTGSSLALIHRLSPGPATLPHPGILVTDPVARRAFLTSPENKYLATTQWCPPKVDEVGSLTELLAKAPVAVVSTTSGPKNYITRDSDWFTPIMQTLIGGHDLCLVGRDEACNEIIGLMSKWASADALKPAVKRTARQFDDISWIANSLAAQLHLCLRRCAQARSCGCCDRRRRSRLAQAENRRIPLRQTVRRKARCNPLFGSQQSCVGGHDARPRLRRPGR
jgi:hypothetical protein